MSPIHRSKRFRLSVTYFVTPMAICAISIADAAQPQSPKLVSQGLAGYISMRVPAPPAEYGYGVSLYATAWPLLEKPLSDFQIGLASIWIVPENRSINYPLLPKGTLARDSWPERGPSYRDVFQTIEGGLGFWANTRFGSPTAKFRMNGTNDGYNHEISTPGWAFGGGPSAKALAADKMGIAQLSSRILVPPDGLTFKKGTCGELLGYAWMALPLTRAKATTAGINVPTGNQCWTLFLNTQNARGPVAFYTPSTWSRISRQYPPAAARGLDTRPGLVTGGAIEINTVPRMVAADAKGVSYTRIPRLQFPVDKDGHTVLIHNLTHYSKDALYSQVERWMNGGEVPTGAFDSLGAIRPACTANPLVVRQGEAKTLISSVGNWVDTVSFDSSTFGLKWNPSVLQPWANGVRKGVFPEYAKKEGNSLVAVSADSVPDETGLKQATFPEARKDLDYVSPESGNSVWTHPGPAAGPFKAKLSDGSILTYYWYRFIDQPSLQDADLTAEEKARLQLAAEGIQSHWTLDKQYMAAPTTGTLATLDPALLVKPPHGLEVGFVPIVVRQGSLK